MLDGARRRARRSAARRLDEAERTALYEHPRLGRLAAGSTAPEFRRGLEQLVRELQADDGVDQFERQHAGNRFSCRLNPGGMYRLDGWLDPEHGRCCRARSTPASKPCSTTRSRTAARPIRSNAKRSCAPSR